MMKSIYMSQKNEKIILALMYLIQFLFLKIPKPLLSMIWLGSTPPTQSFFLPKGRWQLV